METQQADMFDTFLSELLAKLISLGLGTRQHHFCAAVYTSDVVEQENVANHHNLRRGRPKRLGDWALICVQPKIRRHANEHLHEHGPGQQNEAE